MGITAIAIFTTLLLVSAVFYDLFQKQIFEDLSLYARILSMQNDEIQKEAANLSNRIRVTLVAEDGTVLYDNAADISVMDKHHTRPEIKDALANGEGRSVRRSDTLDRNNFYYALLLDNGHVLRVAKEADSLFSVLNSAFPVLLFTTSLLLLICVGLSHFLTGSLLKPIEQLAEKLDSQEEITAYEELDPVIKTIQAQHKDILKNAKMRQEFTANVSHELKTPLTSISGYSELIENGMASGDDMVRFASEIHKSANRLLTLINDIIQLAELDSNAQEITFEDVSMYQLAQNCVEMMQVNAAKHNVTLSLDGKECRVYANRQMLEEILYNLCDNAIRYNNEDGYVRVGVYPKQDEAVLVVEDSGIGIPKEHQERIFERFYRVDKSRSKSTGGTGLGLAIVKHIVAQHGASMDLQSEVGKGTKITISFPHHL